MADDAPHLLPQSLRVKINVVTLADWNLDEVEKLAALARDRQLDVRFIEMMPVGLGRQFAGYGQEQILKRLEAAYGPATLYEGGPRGNGPATYYKFLGFRGQVGFISALSHRFCSGCNRVRLTSEGLLRLCLESETGIDLRGPLREGAGDDVLRTLIEESIACKPLQHRFSEVKKCVKPDENRKSILMSSIGG